MQPVTFQNAFYIKLGRGGCWEKDSIENSRLRLGWSRQSIDDINNGRWEIIANQLRVEHEGKPPQVATNDLNRLRDIATSTGDDIWITFHGSKLWWTRLAPTPLQADEISKFRETLHPWRDAALNEKLLIVNELPGKIAQLQGFRGTACKVKEPELLQRILEGARSTLASSIAAQRTILAGQLSHAITELHWKDFETLVDLVFRDAGWLRISVLGQHAKAYDLELREPITGERYVVQVKSQATLADLTDTIKNFSPDDFRKVFFVVHSPSTDLATASDVPDWVDLVDPEHLAKLALAAGLSQWIEDKVA